VIRGCLLYHNRQNGILRGALDQKRVVLERNHEFENRGLPPDMTAVHAAARKKAERTGQMPNAAGRQVKKGGDGSPDLDELRRSMVEQQQHQKYMKRCL
jgi:hypothetical protein